jgi:hypothetical protein
VLLTTMVDGDVQGGIAWVAHRMGLEGESYDNPRLVPAAEVKSWFEMLAPVRTASWDASRISGIASTTPRASARRPHHGDMGGRRRARAGPPARRAVSQVRAGP